MGGFGEQLLLIHATCSSVSQQHLVPIAQEDQSMYQRAVLQNSPVGLPLMNT